MPSWPSYSEDEIQAVKRVLESNNVNYWTGDEGRKFESEFAKYLNLKKSIAVSNGTVALELALMSLGLDKKDEVIVTPRTFIASVSSIVNLGLVPVFADIDLNSGNITLDSIKKAYSERTKAIICVHLGGYPCDMGPIMEFSKSKGIFVIEDCAQAHGAKYKNSPIGSFGDISAWSFCQDKIISTGGEGGMIATDNIDLYEKMWSLKDHGKNMKKIGGSKRSSSFNWIHDSFGSNYRMTEMQAAIGRIQLRKLSDWNKKRTLNAMKIMDHCLQYPSLLRVPLIPDNFQHAFYKCYIYLKSHNLSPEWTREKIIDELNLRGTACYPGSCSEVYLEDAFMNRSFKPNQRLKNAKELGEVSLMFLVHPNLHESDIDLTCENISEVMNIIN